MLYQDQVYALPLHTVSMALIYNRDLVSEEDLPASTDELLERAREWTETEYYFVYYAPLLYYSAAWFHGGGAWYANDACQPNLDNPAGVAGAELIAAFRQIMPLDVDYGTPGELFAAGEVPIILGGPWDLVRAQEIDYGVALLPVVSATGAPAAPYVDFEGFMLTAAAVDRQVDAVAWDVMQFLSSHDAQLRFAQANYLAPTLRSVVEDEQLESALAVFVEQAEHGYPAPPAECMGKVFPTMDKALRDLWGGAEPAEIMAEAQQELEDRLE
jgi:arabinogalactan oligomer/maltooligosaccharide transport system substrate-binding protein